VLAILPRCPEELHLAALRTVERVLEGNERRVAAALDGLPPSLARELLAILGRKQTADAVTALADVAGSADLALRVEAIAQRAQTPEQLRAELAPLAEHPREDVRLAALRAMATHRVRELGPALVRRIEDPAFHGLTLEERRAMLQALVVLNATRAESLAAQLLAQHGMLRSDARDQSRLLAAELLAAHGRSKSALDALAGAAKSWWWNSDALREIATAGMEAVTARMNEGSLR
jgi:hypothetical protein